VGELLQGMTHAASRQYATSVSDDAMDVPSPIDLRDPAVAHTWANEADAKRPWREQLRGAIADALAASTLPVRRVLELGSGPGLLAERILSSCALERYTLFDFSPPMLELSRARVGANPAARFVLGDFKQSDWTRAVDGSFDAVVTMQAVHELRHKRRAPALYRDVRGLVRPGGFLLVCDHTPADGSARATALNATEAEQHAAMIGAGFTEVTTLLRHQGLYLCSGRG
jgi:SAM-dependent methyltransferase